MAFIPFGDLAPDQPSINLNVMHRAENCLFINGAYRPLPGYGATRDILSTDLTGLRIVKSEAFSAVEVLTVLVLQDQNSVYIGVVARGSLTLLATHNIIRPSSRWNMVRYGARIVIGSAVNPLMVLRIEPESAYTAASLSVIEDVDDDGNPAVIRGALIAVVRDRLFHAGDPKNLFRVRFSASNALLFDPTDTLQPGGSQEIPGTGVITALTGGEVGHVFTERGIDLFTETGNDLIYQRDNISNAVGCRRSGWVYRVGSDVYFHSYSGFKKIGIDGVIMDIGHGRIDAWMDERPQAAQESVFHWNDLKMLLFYQINGVAVAYNYVEDRFTTINTREETGVDVNWHGWTRDPSSAVSISDSLVEGVTLDAAAVDGSRLDDTRWAGGFETFNDYFITGGSLHSRRIGYGPGHEQIATIATFETGEIYATTWLEGQQDERKYRRRSTIPPTSRLYSSEGRLVGNLTDSEGDYDLTAQIAVASRDTVTESPWQFGDWRQVLGVPHDALCPWNESGRYMAFRVELDGRWGYLSGLDVALEGDGSGPVV